MQNDIDRLQGNWIVSALEMDGQQLAADIFAAARLVVNGNRFSSSGMGAVYEGTLSLDETKVPRQLDMKFDSGPEKGNTNLCIYEISGDAWKICIATRGTVRPAKFASKPGSGFAYEELTRDKVQAAQPSKRKVESRAATKNSDSAPVSEFEGSWQMVSGVMNGLPMEASITKFVTRVTNGNETSVIAGPQTLFKFEFICDSTKSPKTLDYFHTAGANKGKNQVAIYECDGTNLKICASAPGTARPTRFESIPGDGGSYTVWKKL